MDASYWNTQPRPPSGYFTPEKLPPTPVQDEVAEKKGNSFFKYTAILTGAVFAVSLLVMGVALVGLYVPITFVALPSISLLGTICTISGAIFREVDRAYERSLR